MSNFSAPLHWLTCLILCCIYLSTFITAQSVIVPDSGRECIVGLGDCPENESCIPQNENYGHCG